MPRPTWERQEKKRKSLPALIDMFDDHSQTMVYSRYCVCFLLPLQPPSSWNGMRLVKKHTSVPLFTVGLTRGGMFCFCFHWFDWSKIYSLILFFSSYFPGIMDETKNRLPFWLISKHKKKLFISSHWLLRGVRQGGKMHKRRLIIKREGKKIVPRVSSQNTPVVNGKVGNWAFP